MRPDHKRAQKQDAAPKFETPPAVSRIVGVSPETVIDWIESGVLPAMNTARPGSKRPRYRVDMADLAVLKQRLAVVPQPEKPKTRLPRPKLDPSLPIRYLS